MLRRIGGSICALALFAAAPASAEEIVAGTVSRVDERAGVIVFEDGRVMRTTGDMVVLVENRPDRLAAVKPGSRVVVISRAPAVQSDDDREPMPSASGRFDAPASEIQAP